MKAQIFFILLFNFLIAEIYISQANLVGQTLDILVENGANQTITIQAPNGDKIEKKLDEAGQTKIFLDQEGLWKIYYNEESKSFYVKDIQKKVIKNEKQDLTFLFVIVVFLLVFGAAYLLFYIYKNLYPPLPKLFKTKKESLFVITFQAAKNLIKNVRLELTLKNSQKPLFILREKMQPFEKIQISCNAEEFEKAVCIWQENNQKFSLELKDENLVSLDSTQVLSQPSFSSENTLEQKQKRKLKKAQD